MDKKKIIEQITLQLEKDLIALKAAALATYEAATHEESKAENKYDTRGLEASYLAGAQAKRVQELEEQLALYKNIVIKDFDETTPISATAIVEVESNQRTIFVLLMPIGGGLSLSIGKKSIQVISQTSPLGSALLGLKEGDMAIMETGNQTKEYEIISVH